MRRLTFLVVLTSLGCGVGGVIEDADAGPRDAGSADAGTHDAGSASSDAGSMHFDAGTVGSDAGTVEPDAGTVEPDAGTVEPDAGTVEPDAGTVEPDAGTVEPDAGTVEPDAGTVEPDAGAVEPDAGAVEPDAGAVEPDAGAVEPDAGAVEPDAGVPLGPDFVIEGFGAATRGGWQPGFDEVFVTTLNDSGPGSLREALDSATGPRVIRFQVDGTIALANTLFVPSNITIDGRGHAITLQGKGLVLLGSDEVIITHLSLLDVGPDSEDGLRIGDPTLGPSERVVIDHVTFRATGNNGDSANVDEAMSVIFGSRELTVQWVRVENWEKVLLIGNGDAPQSVDQAITLSMHHSYFKNTGRRHPQARYGQVDVWNCFFDDWRMYDWFYLAPYRESFGVQSQDSARVRVENSLFRRFTHTKDALSQADDATRCETQGLLDGVGLVVTSDSQAPLRFNVDCAAANWARPYSVTMDTADATLRTRLETETGP